MDSLKKVIQKSSNEEIIEEKPKSKEFTRKYRKGRLLGKGGFGECFEFKCIENNKIYAGKIINKKLIYKGRNKYKLISEINIHRTLHHPNIVNFSHYFEDKNNIYILSELCENQTLRNLIKNRKHLTELEVQCYMIQLIKALKYIHSNLIIHRDLKLSNIFLTDKMELKLGDFGLAAKLSHKRERRMTCCGTPNYMAPEIVNKNYPEHSFEVDIWSLGIIIFVLLIGKFPFEAENTEKLYQQIRYYPFKFTNNNQISKAAEDLIKQILVKDPEKRPTLDKILSHDFFHLGNSIPKLLPIYTLYNPPNIDYIHQYMPQADNNGIVDKDVTTIDLIGQSHKELSPPFDFVEFQKKMEELDKKLEINIFPKLWVENWLDYSKKYGLGYKLNNGNYGVFFNDCTNIILNSKLNIFFYIENRKSNEESDYKEYTFDNYPIEIKDKIILFKYFKKYINEQIQREEKKNKDKNNNNKDINEIQTEKDNIDNNNNNKKSITFMRSWLRTKGAISFKLSDGTMQVVFQDNIQIILFYYFYYLTYINKEGKKVTYLLSTSSYISNEEMRERLKYVKQLMKYIVNQSSYNKKDMLQEKNEEIKINENEKNEKSNEM